MANWCINTLHVIGFEDEGEIEMFLEAVEKDGRPLSFSRVVPLPCDGDEMATQSRRHNRPLFRPGRLRLPDGLVATAPGPRGTFRPLPTSTLRAPLRLPGMQFAGEAH